MTDEQRQRIHAITYSTEDRMELAERIVRLEDENADLKRQLRQADEIIGRQGKNLEKSNDENAKLRESVRNLLTCVKHEECEESCPNYEPMYTDYGYKKNGSTVVESEYLGCCTVGLENCNSMLFDTDEYLRELGIEVPHDN